jgi:hypothetical protein
MNVVFVEARSFTRRWPDYMTEEELREFQNYVLETPDAGDVIKGTGGIRKVRWQQKGVGKRGGLRIIYFWQVADGHIYLLTVYQKNEYEDLSKDEYKLLKKVVERW